MTNIYERLGVRTIINGQGPATRLSGGIMPAEVAQAMVEASRHCVDIAELQAAASRTIAEATGAEAGLGTSGAAAGLGVGHPVLVDAAAQLPPTGNLQRFIAEGADLVVFSGGKAMRGPQSSGILCGRRDLIAAAALQMLDQDTRPELWLPPADFIDRRKLPGAPQHGIGRVRKVRQGEIVGLLTALRLFIGEDPAARRERWTALMDALATALEGLPNCRVARVADAAHDDMPLVDVILDRRASNRSALELAREL